MKCLIALLALAAGGLVSPAHAGVIATLSATYVAFDATTSSDTRFTVTNRSGATLTGVTLATSVGPTISVVLPDLVAGASEGYDFDRFNGGFTTDPYSVGTELLGPTYSFSATFGGAVLSSAAFSPASNLTGAYVDFLGTTCQGLGGCAVAQDGVVAELITAAVPAPASVTLLAAGLLGAGLLRRRA